MRSVSGWGIVLFGAFAVLSCMVLAADSQLESEAPTASDSASGARLREGTKLQEQVGEFQKTTDRVNFYPKDGQGAIRVLENLAMERVARVLQDSPTPRLWSVSGVITEYRGENFLLITRAVLKARPVAALGGRESKTDESPLPAKK